MVVLGLDPGTATVGFAFVTGSKQDPKILQFGILQTLPLPNDLLGHRLNEIGSDLEYLLDTYKPELAGVEEIFFFKNHKTVISVAHSRGMMIYLLAKRGIRVLNMTPLEIKQAVCSYGRADKKQMQTMIMKLYSLDSLPKPDDAADSLAMAWCGL